MSDDGGILDFLKDKAPDLAMALGDTVTGGAVSRIASAVGIDTNDPEELKDKLQRNPKLLTKLKQQERRLALKELRARLDDKQSARQMATRREDPDVDRLAYVILSGFFVLTTIVIGAALWPSVEVSAEIMSVAATLIGMASQKASQVVSFYFGSSTGSKSKEHKLQSAMQKLGTSA